MVLTEEQHSTRQTHYIRNLPKQLIMVLLSLMFWNERGDVIPNTRRDPAIELPSFGEVRMGIIFSTLTANNCNSDDPSGQTNWN